jgi:hypothetical protein
MSQSTIQPPTVAARPGKHELPDEARQKISNVKAIPEMPMILMPLLALLQKPADQVPIDEVVRLVSYDKTIAAQGAASKRVLLRPKLWCARALLHFVMGQRRVGRRIEN